VRPGGLTPLSALSTATSEHRSAARGHAAGRLLLQRRPTGGQRQARREDSEDMRVAACGWRTVRGVAYRTSPGLTVQCSALVPALLTFTYERLSVSRLAPHSFRFPDSTPTPTHDTVDRGGLHASSNPSLLATYLCSSPSIHTYSRYIKSAAGEPRAVTSGAAASQVFAAGSAPPPRGSRRWCLPRLTACRRAPPLRAHFEPSPAKQPPPTHSSRDRTARLS